MHNALTTTLFLMAGFTIFSAITHLFIALHQRRRAPHLLLGLSALMAFGYIVLRAIAYTSPSAESMVELRRADVTLACLFTSFFLGFVTQYCNLHISRIFALFQITSLFLIIANLLLPYGIHYQIQPVMDAYVLPWREIIFDAHSASGSPWQIAFWSYILCAFSYCFYGGVSLYLRGDTRSALLFLVSISMFLILTLLTIIVHIYQWNFVHPSDFGLSVLIAVLDVDLMFYWRREKKRLSNILNFMPFCVSLKDPEGHYVILNQTFRHHFTSGSDAPYGLDDKQLFGDTLANIFSSKARLAIEQNYPNSTEFELNKGGNKRIYQLVQFPIPDLKNSTCGTGSLFMDITHERRTDQTLHELRNQVWFSDRVTNTSAIARSLAHEISQPLTAILNNAQAGLRFIEKGEVQVSELKDIFRDIVADEKRAGVIVNSLRNMLQQKDLPSENLFVDQAILEILDFLHSELLQKNIALEYQLEPRLKVWANKILFQQVLLNLIINSIETMEIVAMDQRRLSITAGQQKNNVQVSLSDSRPGIHQDVLEDIFKGAHSTQPPERGMGLEICKAIIEIHGGNIYGPRGVRTKAPLSAFHYRLAKEVNYSRENMHAPET